MQVGRIMEAMATLYFTHPACRQHEMGEGHPECPARLDAISDQLLASGVAAHLIEREAPQATQEALLRVLPPNTWNPWSSVRRSTATSNSIPIPA